MSMNKRVEILTGDVNHPFMESLRAISKSVSDWDISFHVDINTLEGADILFLASCPYYVTKSIRRNYHYTFLVHASNLPEGRGWSPYIWELLSGAENITLTLLEAADAIDSGDIWKKINVEIEKYLDYCEISERISRAQAMLFASMLHEYPKLELMRQSSDILPTYYPKRTPSDSKIDPTVPLINNFNKIRLCDPVRYPAFFDLDGHRYLLRIERVKDDN